jgi:hypothetical protein
LVVIDLKIGEFEAGAVPMGGYAHSKINVVNKKCGLSLFFIFDGYY